MKRRGMWLWTGVIIVNILCITLPLSIENLNFRRDNQRLLSQMQEGMAGETEENYYQMIEAIRIKLIEGELHPLSEKISVKDGMYYSLILPFERQKIADFCEVLTKLPQKVYLSEVNVESVSDAPIFIRLEYYGESND